METSEVERAALMQTSRDWAKASSKRDVDRILSFWAEDAIVLPPNQPALVGKRAIREYVVQSLAMPGFSITWEPERAAVGGDFGYMVERNQSTFIDASGASRMEHGKGVTIWRRDSAGRWKCVIDIWNGNPSDRVLVPR